MSNRERGLGRGITTLITPGPAQVAEPELVTLPAGVASAAAAILFEYSQVAGEYSAQVAHVLARALDAAAAETGQPVPLLMPVDGPDFRPHAVS
ncbi:hypothetical protein AB0M43_38270 [Longispora sp. NPDC051575]|uniref:hypothetical protein n=1 Tax=Longispora sp. NPDC051575 TaxID=3154943 RepID=UPI00344A087F